MKFIPMLSLHLVAFLCFYFNEMEKPSIFLDEKESTIIVDNERNLLTIYALLQNEGSRPSDDLFASFIIQEDSLSDILGFQNKFYQTNPRGIPKRFNIEENNGFFISESFPLSREIHEDDIDEAIILRVYNEEGQLLENPLWNVKIE